jgi:phenylpropionate dioxygenase-like ring-hydroxylating dioxygenase large terminal subunit
MPIDPDRLVVDDGRADFRVHTSAYLDPRLFEVEMERIFEQTWVYVAHESEIPEAGDFRTSVIGTQPVLVTRDTQGRINVMLNRCRHRASIICRDEHGRAERFQCPYHGWVYGNDGALLGIAQADGYPPDFDRATFGLQHVPRLDTYRGLIFASLNPAVESLQSRLAHIKRYVDIWCDKSPVGRLRLTAATHRYSYPGNWKLQMDNGVDGYHGNYVHESFVKVTERAGEMQLSEFTALRKTGYTRGLNHGDGLIDRPYGGMAGQFDYHDHALDEYHRQLTDAYGPERAAQVMGQQNVFVFPNLFLFESHVRVIRPVNVRETVVEMHPFMLEGVSEALNTARLRTHERFFGPAGFGAPDDVEMFVNVQSGLQARAVEWLVMNRGMHREVLNEDGEYVGASTDEAPQRAAYREWRRLMTANASEHRAS